MDWSRSYANRLIYPHPKNDCFQEIFKHIARTGMLATVISQITTH